MKRIAFGGTLLAVTLILGCSTVRSLHPIGEPLAEASKSELGEVLDGVWLAGEGVVHMKAIGPSMLRIAWTEWKQDRYVLHQTDVQLTLDDDLPYVNIVDPASSGGAPEYFFARATVGGGGALWSVLAPATTGDSSDELLVLYPPSAAAFEAAVDEGVLPGSVEKSGSTTHVHLTADKQALDDFITPDEAAQQFDFSSPIVLRRIVSSDGGKQREAGQGAGGASGRSSPETLLELERLAETVRALARRHLELADFEQSQFSDEGLAWSRRLCVWDMRVAIGRTEAIAAAQRHREYLQSWLRVAQEKKERGLASQADLDLLRYYLAEAELWLAEAQRGLPPTGSADPPPLSLVNGSSRSPRPARSC